MNSTLSHPHIRDPIVINLDDNVDDNNVDTNNFDGMYEVIDIFLELSLRFAKALILATSDQQSDFIIREWSLFGSCNSSFYHAFFG